MSLYDDLDKDVEVVRSEINALANKPPPPLKPKNEPPKDTTHDEHKTSMETQTKLFESMMQRKKLTTQTTTAKPKPNVPKQTKVVQNLTASDLVSSAGNKSDSTSIQSLEESEIYDPMYPNEYEDYAKERGTRSESSSSGGVAVPPPMYKDDDDIVVPSVPTTSNLGKFLGLSKEPVEKKLKPTVIESVVVLKNIVGPGEVDEELQPEIEQECTKFGTVVACILFESKLPGVPEEEAVRIFVHFKDEEAAKKAISAMNNRFFGGRKIAAEQFPLKKFEERDLDYEFSLVK